MLFKDVKQGCPLYIFDRNSVSVKTGNITGVTFPHLSNQPNGGMVVDVTVNVDGNAQTYEIKDTSESAYVGTTMLTPNVDSVLTEIRALKTQSEEIVRSVDKHEGIISKCSTLLSELDPVYKEKQLNEQRLSRLEESIDKLALIVEKMNTNKMI